MTKHLHRADGPPIRRAVPVVKRTTAPTTVPTVVPVRRVTPAVDQEVPNDVVAAPATLAEHQDAESSAPNDTGTPKTPAETPPAAAPTELEEGREKEKLPGEEEVEGAAMDWFDRLGE